MGEVRYTAERVIRAIDGSGGIKVKIARQLGVHRDTVENYLKRYPTVRDAYDQEVASVGDDAENVIIDAIRGQDPDRALDTAKWYARMKLKDRGYVERNEHANAPGEEFRVVVQPGDYGAAVAPFLPPGMTDDDASAS